jgi:hypothetical protein
MSNEDLRYAGKEPATRRRGTWKTASVCKLGFFPVHRIWMLCTHIFFF